MSAVVDRQALEDAFIVTYDRERDIGAALDSVIAVYEQLKGSPKSLLSVRSQLAARIAKRKGTKQRPVKSHVVETVTLSRYRMAAALRPFIEAMALARGMLASDLTGVRQDHGVVVVRDEIVWLLRQQKPPVSFSIIGLAFGGRDHSSMMAARRRFEARLAAEPGLRERALGELREAA